MLEYKAAYGKENDGGWLVAKVLDFPGVASQGRTLATLGECCKMLCVR